MAQQSIERISKVLVIALRHGDEVLGEVEVTARLVNQRQEIFVPIVIGIDRDLGFESYV